MTSFEQAQDLFRHEPSEAHARRYEIAINSADDLEPKQRADALHEIDMFYILLSVA